MFCTSWLEFYLNDFAAYWDADDTDLTDFHSANQSNLCHQWRLFIKVCLHNLTRQTQNL